MPGGLLFEAGSQQEFVETNKEGFSVLGHSARLGGMREQRFTKYWEAGLPIPTATRSMKPPRRCVYGLAAQAGATAKLIFSGCGRKFLREAHDYNEREGETSPWASIGRRVIIDVYRVCCRTADQSGEGAQLPRQSPLLVKRFEEACGTSCEICTDPQVATSFDWLPHVRAIDLRISIDGVHAPQGWFRGGQMGVDDIYSTSAADEVHHRGQATWRRRTAMVGQDRKQERSIIFSRTQLSGTSGSTLRRCVGYVATVHQHCAMG